VQTFSPGAVKKLIRRIGEIQPKPGRGISFHTNTAIPLADSSHRLFAFRFPVRLRYQ